MAPLKRKGAPTNESFVRSIKREENGPPSKRLRKEAAPSTSSNLRGVRTFESPGLLNSPRISTLKDDDAAFPRGGASVLTPLEYKQINIEATRDILFEENHASRRNGTKGKTNDDLPGPETAWVKTRQKSKAGKKEIESQGCTRIEGLSYKVIPPLHPQKIQIRN
jgi:rRNA biogenesis protein RRP5